MRGMMSRSQFQEDEDLEGDEELLTIGGDPPDPDPAAAVPRDSSCESCQRYSLPPPPHTS